MFKNIVEKGENASNQHFVLSQNVFYQEQKKKNSAFKLNSFCHLQVPPSWTSENFVFDKE